MLGRHSSCLASVSSKKVGGGLSVIYRENKKLKIDIKQVKNKDKIYKIVKRLNAAREKSLNNVT